MRMFELHRDVDGTGLSGTGVVAQGVEFGDGTVAMRWAGAWPTSVVFYERGIDSVIHLHGHGGDTRMVFVGGSTTNDRQMEPPKEQHNA